MHFSEDDLEKALKRKDPGQGFTQRVMAKVNQAQAGDKAASQPKAKKPNGSPMAWWNLRPAWTIAVVAILLLAFGVGGYQYSEYRHAQEMRIAREKNEKLQREAEKARDEAIMALEIARNKLNHVLQHTQLPIDSDEKIRRQRL
jgi:cytochrome c-type biogenesis protein CcmH/NrfG